MQLTVADILELPSVRHGEPEVVCAGPMDQPVRWVHVSDLADLSGLLTGGELVLTTGQALADPARRDAYLPGLAEAGATGVVIELGLHIDSVPESVRAIGTPL
jgi:purine catabolism regulator